MQHAWGEENAYKILAG